MNNARNMIHMPELSHCPYTGRGVGIAFLDTGIFPHRDFSEPFLRIAAFMDFVRGRQFPYDDNGHGTHICGIAAGSGAASGGRYRGIAPGSRLIAGKVLDEHGDGSVKAVLKGISWIIDNRFKYGIRILNISIGAEAGEKPADSALLVQYVEKAWDSGLVVVVAAGNNGPRPMSVTAPGTSPKVITVGSSDDSGRVRIHGETVCSYSGRDTRSRVVLKPDVVAPGSNIISCAAGRTFGQHAYANRSGTSMATPIVSGAAALLLEKYPELDNNTVKHRICQSCDDLGFSHSRQGFGQINIQKLLH